MRSIFQVFSFDIISKILVGFIGIILIRYMKESEYALYTFALSIITIVSQTITSTFRRIYIVGYESFQLDQYKESFLGLIMIIILLFASITIPFVHYFNGVLVWIILMIIGFTLVDFGKTVFQQEYKFMKFSMVEIGKSISFFVITMSLIYFYKQKIGAWQIFLIQSGTMILVYIVATWGNLKIKGLFKIIVALKIGKTIFTGPYKFLIGYTLFATVLGQLDVLMLRYYTTEKEIATYGSAFRYYSLLLLALSSVNTVFLPVIQNINNRSELDELYKKHAKMLTFFIPLVILGAWLSKWIIPMIDLGKYPNAVPVFQVLAISAILSFIFSPHTNLIMKFEEFKFLFYLLVISVVMNIILNSFMVPKFGSLGAAVATLITFGFSNFMTYVRAKRCRINLSAL